MSVPSGALCFGIVHSPTDDKRYAPIVQSVFRFFCDNPNYSDFFATIQNENPVFCACDLQYYLPQNALIVKLFFSVLRLAWYRALHVAKLVIAQTDLRIYHKNI
jgi:hypothetical protein